MSVATAIGPSNVSYMVVNGTWIDYGPSNKATEREQTTAAPSPPQPAHRLPPFDDPSLLQLPHDPNVTTCAWVPNDPSSCFEQLRSIGQQQQRPRRRRVLFFGDSTVRFLFSQFSISTPLLEHCEAGTVIEQTDRCYNHDLYEIDPPIASWKLPSAVEGPAHYGRQNPHCSDCSECATRAFLPNADADCPLYGGYFAIEFARDVVLQSTLYGTTQENILHYCRRHYPSVADALHICVVSTGQHDVSIPALTPDLFGENARWYTEQLRVGRLCDTVVWIGNTAPAREHTEWPQGRKLMRQMDHAVLQHHASVNVFVDVFPASLTSAHMDNIHMAEEWYEALAQTLHDTLLV